MSTHLAAAALGNAVGWITAIDQEDIQHKVKPLLGGSTPANLMTDAQVDEWIRTQRHKR
jgi:hypothetical protein